MGKSRAQASCLMHRNPSPYGRVNGAGKVMVRAANEERRRLDRIGSQLVHSNKEGVKTLLKEYMYEKSQAFT